MTTLYLGPIVRYVDENTAAVWALFGRRAAVALLVEPMRKSTTNHRPTTYVTYTTEVRPDPKDITSGGHFALMYVTDLEPGTWYRYRVLELDISDMPRKRWPKDARAIDRNVTSIEHGFPQLGYGGAGPVFRTLSRQPKNEEFRLAFGSCLKWRGGFAEKKGANALSLFDAWMGEREQDRLTKWPSIMLLVGDQVYGDDITPWMHGDMKRHRKQRQKSGDPPIIPTELDGPFRSPDAAGIGNMHAIDFEEYAHLYWATWAEKPTARVLANIPTYMMFDDHDVTDDWNITGGWFKQMLNTPGWTETLIDALVAYWVFQGWGNLHPVNAALDPRNKILREAADRGTNAIEPLRTLILSRLESQAPNRLPWHYRLPTTSPPIFILDTRNDRELAIDEKDPATGVTLHASLNDRIMTKHQLDALFADLKKIDEPPFLVTGAPIMLPLELQAGLIFGARPILKSIRDTERLDQHNQDVWEILRREHDTEPLAAFPHSLYEFVVALRDLRDSTKKDHTLIFLSGDVHFSYAMWGRIAESSGPAVAKYSPRLPYLVQLVSSPLQNALEEKDEKKPLLQFLSLAFDDADLFRNVPNGQVAQLKYQVTKLFVETATGAKKDNANGFGGPRFDYINPQVKKAGRSEKGLLFGDTIALVILDKDRTALQAEWWNAGPGDTKLIHAATQYEKLR
jgi:phosphodiesterase/alkaline phosphatase D-like protein